MRMVDLTQVGCEVRCRCQEIALESIQRFDHDPDITSCRDVSRSSMKLNSALAFLVGRRVTGKMADGRMDRPADLVCAECLTALKRPGNMGKRGLPLLARRAY